MAGPIRLKIGLIQYTVLHTLKLPIYLMMLKTWTKSRIYSWIQYSTIRKKNSWNDSNKLLWYCYHVGYFYYVNMHNLTFSDSVTQILAGFVVMYSLKKLLLTKYCFSLSGNHFPYKTSSKKEKKRKNNVIIFFLI